MKAHTVNSGTYSISNSKPEVLNAFLGSCVGVTLCDSKAGIGGLIHLLLPEPPSMDLSWSPEVSAVTGIPVFLAELCAQGARKERLEACIAGGALIDPVTKADLVLDLGGRTAEMAHRILQNEKIPVRKSEIGGYFSCCLSLDLTTWETKIDPLVIPPMRPLAEKTFKPPTPQQLDCVIETLMPIPQTALKVVRMINAANYSFKELAKEVIQEQVLSARIIRMCNSVVLSPRMKVDSIEKALVRIGEKNLLLLALSFSLEDFISRGHQGYSLCKGGIFHHSFWTATISGKLAEISGRAAPDLAYTAGLLHDIGKVVLDQYMFNAYPLFYRQLQLEESDLIAAEKKLFRVTHTEAGQRLACAWDMPEYISDTILHHHDPDQATHNSELVHIVYIADLLSSRFMPGHELEKMNTTHLRSSLDAIGCHPKDFSVLLTGTPLAAISAGLFD